MLPRATTGFLKVNRKLTIRMTAGTLRPRSFQNIREAVLKVTTANSTWPLDRIKTADELIDLVREAGVEVVIPA